MSKSDKDIKKLQTTKGSFTNYVCSNQGGVHEMSMLLDKFDKIFKVRPSTRGSKKSQKSCEHSL